MAKDLDRAYVINGDDLRIALASMNGAVLQPVPYPRAVAEYIIGKFACPLGDSIQDCPFHGGDGNLGDCTCKQFADRLGVVDAHICCEHVLGSLASDELDVMDKIAGLLRHRSERSRRRVLNWAKDFLLDLAEPPF